MQPCRPSRRVVLKTVLGTDPVLRWLKEDERRDSNPEELPEASGMTRWRDG